MALNLMLPQKRNLLSIGISKFSEGSMHVSFGLRSFFRGQLELLHHLYQMSKRFCLHLFHRPAALNLYCAFRGSQFSSYLLVEHSANNHGNYFLLARGQRVKALPNIRQFRLLLAPRAIPIKCDVHGIEKVLVSKRLRKKFDRSRLHSTNTHGNVTVPAEKNDWDTNISRRKLALKIDTAHARQSDVKHKATGDVRALFVQKTVGGIKGFSLQTDRT